MSDQQDIEIITEDEALFIMSAFDYACKWFVLKRGKDRKLTELMLEKGLRQKLIKTLDGKVKRNEPK